MTCVSSALHGVCMRGNPNVRWSLRNRMLTALALMALLAACTTSPQRQAGALAPGQHDAADTMTSAASRPRSPGPAAGLPVASKQPSMPAQRLRTGLLQLLEHLQSPQDMSPALVERMLGVEMGRPADSGSWLTAYGPVDEGWAYTVFFVPRGDDFPRIDVYLEVDRKPERRSVLTQCTFGVEEFVAELRQKGWTVKDKPYWYVKAWHLPYDRPVPGTDWNVGGEIKFLHPGEQRDEHPPCVVGLGIYVGRSRAQP